MVGCEALPCTEIASHSLVDGVGFWFGWPHAQGSLTPGAGPQVIGAMYQGNWLLIPRGYWD